MDGAIEGKAIGTYMHGPAFARNSHLCDLVISSVVGAITEIGDQELALSHQSLYRERVDVAKAGIRRT
jgi:CobQ-like glutamine amidotransferase family enzyme